MVSAVASDVRRPSGSKIESPTSLACLSLYRHVDQRLKGGVSGCFNGGVLLNVLYP